MGSVGSNLMYFLSSFPDPAFSIIDPDTLEIDNIARHFLGLSYVDNYKVSALKHFYQHSNPNIQIECATNSVIDTITQNLDNINTYDILFICIGKWNIEKWIVDTLKAGKLKLPLCFIWVEPYLIGGHALYIHPEVNKFEDYFDEHDYFRQNVISSCEYMNSNQLLSLRESGCQSTFKPYSKEKLIMFLSRLFPQLKYWISEKPKISESLTWIGKEEDELIGKIKLSEWVANSSSDINVIRG